jgi:hypothetical protein
MDEMPVDTQVAERESARDAVASPSARQSESDQPNALLGAAYAATIFLSAFLLFQVQLIIGKYILPFFGGAPAVWTLCLLFFQVLLLAGYAYAHFVSKHARLPPQGKTHAGVLLGCLAGFVALWVRWDTPLTPGRGWMPRPDANPTWQVLALLAVTVALPFFILSTTGPLLQRWHSRCHFGRTPYRLYALSNTGSLLGVLSYPFLLEWTLTTRQQASLWSICFAFFVLLSTAIALQLPRISSSAAIPASAAPDSAGAPKSRSYLMWLGLSACSSIMLLATTNLLCQDIATIPFLWVLPLALYLLSFIATFASGRWYPRALFWPLYSLILGVGLKAAFQMQSASATRGIATFSAVLLVVCMICQGELARSKPVAKHLTSFYLMIATGSAAGAIFAGLVAPNIFCGYWEFSIALLGCGFLLFLAYALEHRTAHLRTGVWAVSLAILVTFAVPQLAVLVPKAESSRWLASESYVAIVAAAGLLVFFLVRKRTGDAVRACGQGHFPWQPAAVLGLFGLFSVLAYAHTLLGANYVLLRERNFFGIKYVVDGLTSVQFYSGNIVHGGELKDPKRRNIPTFYYQKTSGVGLLLDNYPREGSRFTSGLRVGLVGLGVGTLASYGQPRDQLRFYEVDPAVIRLSTGANVYFHFVQDSRAAVTIIPGDARLSLQGEAARGELQDFDVLALDAFSGDAIPVHLLTREAFGLYLRHLHGPDSVLAFHITNRYVDLLPVVQALCDSYHWNAVAVQDAASQWVLASRNPAMLRLPHLGERAAPIALATKPVLWTDDYSNLFLVLRKPWIKAEALH